MVSTPILRCFSFVGPRCVLPWFHVEACDLTVLLRDDPLAESMIYPLPMNFEHLCDHFDAKENV